MLNFGIRRQKQKFRTIKYHINGVKIVPTSSLDHAFRYFWIPSQIKNNWRKLAVKIFPNYNLYIIVIVTKSRYRVEVGFWNSPVLLICYIIILIKAQQSPNVIVFATRACWC